MQISRLASQALSAPRRASAAAAEPTDGVVLSEAARRTYYDAERDQADQKKYYSQLPPKLDKLTKGEFFRKLNGLTTRTHKHELAYNPGQYLYNWVDLQPNLRLQSVYTDVPVKQADKPRSLEQQAEQWVKALAQGPTDAIGIARRIAQAETESYFNCEHAVPRIYFDDAQPMRGDLHHLFTSEQTINSARSSRPYVDFPEFEGKGDPAIQGHAPELEDGFEPSGGKGAVARATLYFLVRYPGKVGSNYTADDLETLLRWHRENPVSLHERHRNAEIFSRQGNRNPFIDHPEWADKVDFKLGIWS